MIRYIDDLLPSVTERYIRLYGDKLADLSKDNISYFLKPHLCQCVMFVLGRMRYIELFFQKNKEEKFEVQEPVIPQQNSSLSCFYLLDISFQAWANYSIIKYLSPDNVFFRNKKTNDIHLKKNDTRNEGYALPRLNVNHVYGMGRLSQFIINNVLKLLTFPLSKRFISSTKTAKNNYCNEPLKDFMQGMFLETLPRSMGKRA